MTELATSPLPGAGRVLAALALCLLLAVVAALLLRKRLRGQGLKLRWTGGTGTPASPRIDLLHSRALDAHLRVTVMRYGGTDWLIAHGEGRMQVLARHAIDDPDDTPTQPPAQPPMRPAADHSTDTPHRPATVHRLPGMLITAALLGTMLLTQTPPARAASATATTAATTTAAATAAAAATPTAATSKRATAGRTQANGAVALPGWTLADPDTPAGRRQMGTALQVLIALTVLSLAPALLVCMTGFVRIAIVLSMLRHAIGLPETPPNTVLVSLALFLTLFTMLPVIERIHADAVTPYLAQNLSLHEAWPRAEAPLRDFMLRQTREEDLTLMAELSRRAPPRSVDDIGLLQLVPAFMLSELRTAFEIGFVIFLPFVLIDLVVSAVLMALGMMMVPPTTLSLPLKVLLFVLIDGWALLTRALVGSFHMG